MEISKNFAISLILGLFMALSLGGCAYKIYNPNCDLQAVDKFEEFVILFSNCVENDCRKFDLNDFPRGHSLFLKGIGKTFEIDLICGNRNGRSDRFTDVNVCVEDSVTDEKIMLGEYTINKGINRDVQLVNNGKEVCIFLTNFAIEDLSDTNVD